MGQKRHINRLKKPDTTGHGLAFNATERKYLERLASSPAYRDRRKCLDWLYKSFLVRRNRNFILKVAESLIVDGSHREEIRFRALNLIATSVKEYPHKVWPIVVKYGSHRNPHVRGALAACVLEDLMAKHHKDYFPKVRDIVLAGDKRFLDTLIGCWPFGQPKENWEKTVRLIQQAGGDLNRVYRSEKYPLPTDKESNGPLH